MGRERINVKFISRRLLNIRELRIAITVRTAFFRFPIGLQAIVEILKQPGHSVVTDVMPLLHKSVGEVTGALAGPQQRRLRVPTGGRLQQRLQIFDQGKVPRRQTSPSPAATANPLSLWLMVLCTT